MPDSEHLTDDLTAGTRFAPSVPARHEPFPLKGCGALDWGMQSRLARIFRPDSDTPQAMIRAVGAVVHESVKPADAYEQYLRQAASS